MPMSTATQLLGWRVYVSNDLELSLTEAVDGYRNEYLIEQGFGRYKGKALGLRPIYLASDERVKGLVRLLSLGLRILCLLEFSVRSQLRDATTGSLPGLYAGNPKRAPHNSPPLSYCSRRFAALPLRLWTSIKSDSAFSLHSQRYNSEYYSYWIPPMRSIFR